MSGSCSEEAEEQMMSVVRIKRSKSEINLTTSSILATTSVRKMRQPSRKTRKVCRIYDIILKFRLVSGGVMLGRENNVQDYAIHLAFFFAFFFLVSLTWNIGRRPEYGLVYLRTSPTWDRHTRVRSICKSDRAPSPCLTPSTKHHLRTFRISPA